MDNSLFCSPAGRPAARRIGRVIVRRGAVTSTMDEARAGLERGWPDGAVVIADEQLAGRGRGSRVWFSRRGEDVLLSVALRPGPDALGQLTLMAGLATARAIDALTGLRSAIKWPNDVRLRGRKIAGALTEAWLSGGSAQAVVGIGLNVNMDPSRWPEIAGIATSLKQATGKKWDRTPVIEALLAELDVLYQALRDGKSIHKCWERRLETIGKSVELQWGSEVLRGVAEGTDAEGRLLVRENTGRLRAVAAGEVTSQRGVSSALDAHRGGL